MGSEQDDPEAGKARVMRERIRELQAEIARMPTTGLKADKAFFDELSGDDDTPPLTKPESET